MRLKLKFLTVVEKQSDFQIRILGDGFYLG